MSKLKHIILTLFLIITCIAMVLTINENNKLKEQQIYINYMTDNEYDMLCKIVEYNTKDYPFETKCNVASIYINRLNNDTIDITEDIPNVKVSDETKCAIDKVLLFGDTSYDSYYYYPCDKVNEEYDNELQFIFTDGYYNYYGFNEWVG